MNPDKRDKLTPVRLLSVIREGLSKEKKELLASPFHFRECILYFDVTSYIFLYSVSINKLSKLQLFLILLSFNFYTSLLWS